MQVMILAAGKGSRLGEIGTQLPKPLVPICGYPAITFGLALCRAAGLRDIVINLHHHGDLLSAVLGDGHAFGVRIRYSAEEALLGTGGGVAAARRLFESHPVLVMNGKVVADLDLHQVIAAHRAAPSGTAATMVLRAAPPAGEFAPVDVNGAGRVVGLRGTRIEAAAQVSHGRMFTGIHVLEPALLDRLPGGASDLIEAAYLPAMLAGETVWSLTQPAGAYFAEHSTLERYLEGNVALLRAPTLLTHPPGPLVGVDPGATLQPGATVCDPVRIASGAVIEAGATVGPDVVVCSGARVASGARVRHAVVWPGAVARDDVDHAVVTPQGVVRREAV